MRLFMANPGASYCAKPSKNPPLAPFRGIKGADGIYISGTGVDKNADTLPDSLKARVREQAKKDLLVGDYMTKDYVALQQGYLKQHISPNREKAIAQASALMNQVGTNGHEPSVLDLFDMPYSAKIHKGLTRTTAAVFNENGEMIAAYHSDHGWNAVSTQAEDQYWTEIQQLYYDSWTAAKREMQAAQTQGDNASSFSALA